MGIHSYRATYTGFELTAKQWEAIKLTVANRALAASGQPPLDDPWGIYDVLEDYTALLPKPYEHLKLNLITHHQYPDMHPEANVIFGIDLEECEPNSKEEPFEVCDTILKPLLIECGILETELPPPEKFKFSYIM